MFGFISKKKLKDYIDTIYSANRARLGQKYDAPITDEQKISNVYAQGYEDGTDNLYNAICGKFKLPYIWRLTKKERAEK